MIPVFDAVVYKVLSAEDGTEPDQELLAGVRVRHRLLAEHPLRGVGAVLLHEPVACQGVHLPEVHAFVKVRGGGATYQLAAGDVPAVRVYISRRGNLSINLFLI